MSEVLYLKLNQCTEVHGKEVFLGQLGTVWCRDKAIESKCRALKVLNIRSEKKERYVMSVMDLIRKMEQLDDRVEINNIGETDCIIDYQPAPACRPVREWLKTAAVCVIAFFGAAFAIMTFNNDVDVTKVFQEIYYVVTGRESDGFTILELSYSLGLAADIIGFFNHFSKWKINTDPTPLEVEMRLYEDNISKTLIQNADRKESGIDVT